MKRIDEYINEYLDTKINKDTEEYLDYNEPPMTFARANDTIFNTRTKNIILRREMEKKMQDWNDGKRRENIKACNDAKLIVYYQMCKDSGYTECCEKCEAEANRRGWTFEKSNKK